MECSTKKMTAEDIADWVESVIALRKFRKPLVDYLVSGLEEEDKWVRFMAADLLGDIGDSRVVEYLKPLLADQDQDIRAVSARALARVCHIRAAVGGLESGNCDNCMIRFIAQEALIKLKSGTLKADHAYEKGEAARKKEFPDGYRAG